MKKTKKTLNEKEMFPKIIFFIHFYAFGHTF